MRKVKMVVVTLFAIVAPLMWMSETCAQIPVIRFARAFNMTGHEHLMMTKPEMFPNLNKKYEIKWIRVPGAPAQFVAAAAGEVDAGETMPEPLVKARIKGIKVKFVAGVMQGKKDQHSGELYVVLADGGIQSLKDLKGKILAVNTKGSAIAAYLLAGLKRVGIGEKDVTLVEMDWPNMGNALRAKTVDMATLLDPYYTMEKTKGNIKLVFNAYEIIPEMQFLSVWFAEDYLKKYPEVVRAFLSDFQIASKYLSGNEEEAKRLGSEYTKVKLEVFKAMDKWWLIDPKARMNLKAIEADMKLMAEFGIISKVLPIEEVATHEYLPN